MPKSYADLLREARAQIREVTPQEVDALPAGAATIVDVREDVRVGAGPPARRPPRLQVLHRAADRGRRARPRRAGDPVLRRRRPLAVRRPDARRRWATPNVASMSGGFQGWKSAGLEFDTPGRPDRRAEAALQPPPADPGGRRRGPGAAARLEGAAHRRRRARLAGRRSTSPRPASARSASSTSTSSTVSNLQRQIVHTTDRVGERKVESARKSINALNPEVKVVAHEEMLVAANVERIIAGYDVILDGTDTFETRYILNDAAVAAGIPVVHASVFRFEGQLTTFVPYEGPCYRCLYPTPPPPELAPGCSVAGVLGVVPGHPRPAPGERGAQGPARDRRDAGRPAAPVRCPRDRVHRAQAPARPELPGLLRRGRRGARAAGRPAARSTASTSTRRSC